MTFFQISNICFHHWLINIHYIALFFSNVCISFHINWIRSRIFIIDFPRVYHCVLLLISIFVLEFLVLNRKTIIFTSTLNFLFQQILSRFQEILSFYDAFLRKECNSFAQDEKGNQLRVIDNIRWKLASNIQNVVFKLQKVLNQEMVDEELTFELRSQNP